MRGGTRTTGWLLGGVLWLGAAEAGAQAAAALGSRAQVYPVSAPGEASRFRVPQVRLPDAAVARRINRRLLRCVMASEFDTVDSTASPRRQVWQAVRECCYDAGEKSWLAAGQGRTGAEYAVLLNQEYLLSLRITTQQTNLHHDYETTYLTFDLHSERVLTLADVIAEPWPQLRRRMQGAINRRYQEYALYLEDVYSEPGDTARLREALRLLGWDATTHHVRLDWPAADTPGVPELRKFVLTPHALVLFYQNTDFGYWSQGEEPDAAYRFPYRSLQVRPLLAWTRAAKPAALPAKPQSNR